MKDGFKLLKKTSEPKQKRHYNKRGGVVYRGKIAYRYIGRMPENTSIRLREGTKAIADGAFKNCKGLVSVTIPSSVTSIGLCAFYGCTSLTSVTIPSSVKCIGDLGDDTSGFYDIIAGDHLGAFQDCTSLTSVVISEGVTSIQLFAFYGCTSLTSVTIPSSLTYIDANAFEHTFSENNKPHEVHITDINKWVQNCNGYDDNPLAYGSAVLMLNGKPLSGKIVLNDHVTSIGPDSFSGCTEIRSVFIPRSVKKIGFRAFFGCTGLESLIIPTSVWNIGFRAFQGCTGIKSLTIPALRMSRETRRYLDCEQVLVYPSIGYHAFEGWTSSQTICIFCLYPDEYSQSTSDWNEDSSAKIVYTKYRGSLQSDEPDDSSSEMTLDWFESHTLEEINERVRNDHIKNENNKNSPDKNQASDI